LDTTLFVAGSLGSVPTAVVAAIVGVTENALPADESSARLRNTEVVAHFIAISLLDNNLKVNE
jgi:hypothetical protein